MTKAEAEELLERLYAVDRAKREADHLHEAVIAEIGKKFGWSGGNWPAAYCEMRLKEEIKRKGEPR